MNINDKKVSINFSYTQNKTITVDLDGEDISYLGTHIKINQRLVLTHEIINKKTNFIFIIKKVEKLLSLKEKSDSKNRLLSAFTHELKTPLNGSIPPLQEVRNHLSKSSAVYVDRAMASLKVLENSLNLQFWIIMIIFLVYFMLI